MSLAAGTMTFTQHLVLWLHVALAIFTIGPVTLAISSTPRYIRQRNVAVLRYLSRITFVFMIGSIGVLIAGFAVGEMLKVESKPWLIVSATLFLVTIVLLILIVGDQRRAIRAIDEAAGHATTGHATTGHATTGHATTGHATTGHATTGHATTGHATTGHATTGHTAAGHTAAGQAGPADEEPASQPDGETADPQAADQPPAPADAAHPLATVERGRIAMLGGVVSLIYLVILVLMIWNG